MVLPRANKLQLLVSEGLSLCEVEKDKVHRLIETLIVLEGHDFEEKAFNYSEYHVEPCCALSLIITSTT